MAGVAPIVCPEDISHFVHGLFARAACQVVFTVSRKLSLSDGLGEDAEESYAVLFLKVV